MNGILDFLSWELPGISVVISVVEKANLRQIDDAGGLEKKVKKDTWCIRKSEIEL